MWPQTIWLELHQPQARVGRVGRWGLRVEDLHPESLSPHTDVTTQDPPMLWRAGETALGLARGGVFCEWDNCLSWCCLQVPSEP